MENTQNKKPGFGGKRLLAVVAAAGLMGLLLVPGVSAAILAFIAQLTGSVNVTPALDWMVTNTTHGTIVNPTTLDLGAVAAGSTVHLMGSINNNANNDLNGYLTQYRFDNAAHDMAGSPAEFTVKHNGLTATGTCTLGGAMYVYSPSTATYPAGSNNTWDADLTINPLYSGANTTFDVSIVKTKAC